MLSCRRIRLSNCRPIVGLIPLIAVMITGLLALDLVRYSWQGQKRRALVPDGA